MGGSAKRCEEGMLMCDRRSMNRCWGLEGRMRERKCEGEERGEERRKVVMKAKLMRDVRRQRDKMQAMMKTRRDNFKNLQKTTLSENSHHPSFPRTSSVPCP